MGKGQVALEIKKWRERTELLIENLVNLIRYHGPNSLDFIYHIDVCVCV